MTVAERIGPALGKIPSGLFIATATQFADAWAFLVGKVAGRLPAGDHTLYLAEVLDGTLRKEAQEPQVRVRASGFAY